VVADEGFSRPAPVPVNARAAPGSERHQSEQAEGCLIFSHNLKEQGRPIHPHPSFVSNILVFLHTE
jgi:hypothetical protein